MYAEVVMRYPEGPLPVLLTNELNRRQALSDLALATLSVTMGSTLLAACSGSSPNSQPSPSESSSGIPSTTETWLIEATDRYDPSGSQAVVSKKLATGAVTNLTPNFGAAQFGNPKIMPDGKHIVMWTNTYGPYQIVTLPLEQPGQLDHLIKDMSSDWWDPSPDGDRLLVKKASGEDAGGKIWEFNLDGTDGSNVSTRVPGPLELFAPVAVSESYIAVGIKYDADPTHPDQIGLLNRSTGQLDTVTGSKVALWYPTYNQTTERLAAVAGFQQGNKIIETDLSLKRGRVISPDIPNATFGDPQYVEGPVNLMVCTMQINGSPANTILFDTVSSAYKVIDYSPANNVGGAGNTGPVLFA
jgi:hypothetical protein